MENVKELLQLKLKGNPKAVSMARALVNTTLAVFINKAANEVEKDLKWEWDECGYIDNVGGHHDSGVGWSPDGHYCGECSHSTCENCGVWKNKLARQGLLSD